MYIVKLTDNTVYHVSSFKRLGVYLILGFLGVGFIKGRCLSERGVYFKNKNRIK